MTKNGEVIYSRIRPEVKASLVAYASEHSLSMAEATNRLLSNALAIEALSKALGSHSKVQAVIDVPKI